MLTTKELLAAIDAAPNGMLRMVSPRGHEITVYRGDGPAEDWIVWECGEFVDDVQADVARAVFCLSGYEPKETAQC